MYTTHVQLDTQTQVDYINEVRQRELQQSLSEFNLTRRQCHTKGLSPTP